jgi:phosphatidate phosphatase APP1
MNGWVKGPQAVLASLLLVFLIWGEACARDEIGITVHHAYGTKKGFILEGRVAESHRGRGSNETDSWLRNIGSSVRSLLVDERKGVLMSLTFAGRAWALRSDNEGYLSLRAETPPQAKPGWNPVRIETADGLAFTEAQVLIVPEEVTLGIISDFDDTVIISEVPDKSRLLAHTLLENYLQRRPVPGMAPFYRELLARNHFPEAAPMIYLTASPRQLLPGIHAFLEHNGFPTGLVVAKKVTDGDGGDPLLEQERYKVGSIKRILENLPGVRFVLVGDDGERDPEIYREISARYPSRIEAVYIRRVSPDPARSVYPDQQPTIPAAQR